jgi:hypothetical protein
VTARNEPCPCGSGKKFKRCCGSLVGQPRYIVHDPEGVTPEPVEPVEGEEPVPPKPAEPETLSDDQGRIMLFETREAAILTAQNRGWQHRQAVEVLTFAEAKWKQLMAEVPCVLVATREFDTKGEAVEPPSPDTARQEVLVEGEEDHASGKDPS